MLEGTSGLELVRRMEGDKAAVKEVLRFSSGQGSSISAQEAEREIEATIVTTLTGLNYVSAVQKLLFEPLGFSATGNSIEVESQTLALVGQLWLNGGIYAHRRLLSRQTMDQFTARRTELSRMVAAGWWVIDAPGHDFSASSYGWTNPGWESLWIDPERELCVVLLINGPEMWTETREAVPSREKLRDDVHDAIFAALGSTSPK